MATEIRILFHPEGTPPTREPVLEVVLFRASRVTRLLLGPCSRQLWVCRGDYRVVGSVEKVLKMYEGVLDDED